MPFGVAHSTATLNKESLETGHTFDAFWRCSHKPVEEQWEVLQLDIPLMPFGVAHETLEEFLRDTQGVWTYL